MDALKFTLAILAIAGCWRPFSWTSLIKHTLYNAYSLLIISLLYSYTLTQFMNFVLNVNNPDDFTNVVYLMLTLFSSCYKILDLWVNHKSLAELIQNLTEGTFKPLVPVEIEIRRKFDKVIQKRQLTFGGWIPYDYSSFVMFSLTYAHQIVGGVASCIINVACDCLIVGLLLHLCCQITILESRLKGIIYGHYTLSDCVRHHHHIIEYAYATNAKFTKIIAFQFVASTFIMCSNLYQLSRNKFNANFIGLISYTSCVLAEIFIYCWFGNKLKLMSFQLVDNIFETEWIALDNKTKRSLLIIMNRAMRPIEFTHTAHILNMNLDSFVALLKTSYSAYNLLVKIQE
ncbi:odorant receptor 49b-like isoform X2 [Temnothorax longispinosus]|uniref:odorant receptor 49b-like isoform X2 n=1 Tax=Temnothorax longispinosus TaxID=300112 RepID=UPI003A9985F3